MRGDRKDVSKEDDETIVNHFHGVSSSSEALRDVCGQTDPGSCLGSYWTGRMSNEEANSLYKCTVREYHALHKWDAGDTPSQPMELQEMGVDRQGNRETGGSATDRIFFMKYPLPFLQHWYVPYPPPQQDTTTTGSSVVSPSSVGGDTDMAGESTSGVTDSNFTVGTTFRS